MRIDLNEMRRRLNRPIPGLYREFIESSSSNRYEGTLADPAEICSLNLAAALIGPSGPTAHGFVLYGQDGDYYVLCDGDDSGALHSWSHETSQVSRADADAKTLLNALAETPIPDVEVNSLVLSRIEPHTQSMLSPIEPHELPSAAHGVPNAIPFEHLEYVNPFTKEPFSLEVPGIELTLEGREPLILRLSDGCLYGTGIPNPLPEQVHVIARRLGAHIFARNSGSNDSESSLPGR
jgi:hypothetical protein